ncbi:MAG: hypothetical protein COA43_08430 [Robiginitomaculum sp.]|nr:MAG: hypothetical protein COA43_08430 [Robiginitomaculum sp.]
MKTNNYFTAAQTQRNAWIAKMIFLLCAFTFAVLVFYEPAFAHERWVLTPDQMLELNAHPKPKIYTDTTLEGTLMLVFFGAILAFLIRAHYFQHPAKWLVLFSGRVQHLTRLIPSILRLTLSWSLIMSALALSPRLGNSPFVYPTIFAADLEIIWVDAKWHWLVYAELFVGLWLLSGIWTRMAAIATFAFMNVALYIFGEAFLAYYPTLLGVVIYLFFRGSGPFAISIACPRIFREIGEALGDIPLRTPQYILRILAGLNFIYLGVWFKILQPNLAVGIVTIYDMPIMSLAPEFFTLFMACVEIVAGIVIMAGILIRPASLFLLFAFFFFATFLPESYDAHMTFYGVLLAFILGGPGRLHDKGIYQGKLQEANNEPFKKRIKNIISR